MMEIIISSLQKIWKIGFLQEEFGEIPEYIIIQKQ